MTFSSREEAGQKLGRYLEAQHVHAHHVFGLPRGGVIVAAEVARLLRLPLDVIVVRKIGHPRHREFAVGALAEGDIVVLDEAATELRRVVREEMDAVITEEKQRLQEYMSKFDQPRVPTLAGLTVLIIDDGLATGATTEAAVLSARKRMARKVIVAVPVASEGAFNRIRPIADEAFALVVDPAFEAVGRYYEHFSQTTDQEVLKLLGASRG